MHTYMYTYISARVSKDTNGLTCVIIMPVEFGTFFERNHGKVSGIKTVGDFDKFVQTMVNNGLGSEEDIFRLNRLYNWSEASAKLGFLVEVNIKIT